MRGNSCELYVQSPIHASGLRSHGMSPILSELYDQKQMRAVSVEQTEVQIRTNIRPHQRHPLPPPPNPPTPSRPSTNYNLHSPRTRVARKYLRPHDY